MTLTSVLAGPVTVWRRFCQVTFANAKALIQLEGSEHDVVGVPFYSMFPGVVSQWLRDCLTGFAQGEASVLFKGVPLLLPMRTLSGDCSLVAMECKEQPPVKMGLAPQIMVRWHRVKLQDGMVLFERRRIPYLGKHTYPILGSNAEFREKVTPGHDSRYLLKQPLESLFEVDGLFDEDGQPFRQKKSLLVNGHRFFVMTKTVDTGAS